MPQDYYEILGVSKSASDADIQKAYRRLARQHHPDLAEDKTKAKEQFQKIQHAYDVLSDSEKRRRYDQLGPNFESYAGGPQGPFGGEGAEIDLGDLFGRGQGGASFEELLKQFGAFGRGPESSGGRSRHSTYAEPSEPEPRESEQQITIPFGTAILGGEHQLQLAREGQTAESITLKIPAGIDSGQTLRLRGQGSMNRRGKRGDLLVTVQVAAHPHFERRGNNLYVDLPISVSEAILGAKIDIPTPHGVIAITVPPDSSSGKLLRLKGMGVRPPNKPAGDLIVELQIVVPPHLTAEEREQFKAWATQVGQTPPRNLAW